MTYYTLKTHCPLVNPFTPPLTLPSMSSHYETGNYTQRKVFLPDDEYGRALDTLVKACTDLLLTDETGRVLIGKRVVEPQPDFWYGCGGRMKPGETIQASACRLLKRELGLDLENQNHRFSYVGAYSYVWEKRQQAPQTHGTADISVVQTLQLSPSEIQVLKFDSKEYSAHSWFTCEEIVQNEDFHPALRCAVNDVVALREWNKLKVLMQGSSQEDAVSKQLKAYMVRKEARFEFKSETPAKPMLKRQKTADSCK